MVFIMRLNDFLSLWKQAYIEIKLYILLFCSLDGKFVLIRIRWIFSSFFFFWINFKFNDSFNLEFVVIFDRPRNIWIIDCKVVNQSKWSFSSQLLERLDLRPNQPFKTKEALLSHNNFSMLVSVLSLRVDVFQLSQSVLQWTLSNDLPWWVSHFALNELLGLPPEFAIWEGSDGIWSFTPVTM